MNIELTLFEKIQEALKGFTGPLIPVPNTRASSKSKLADMILIGSLSEKEVRLYSLAHYLMGKNGEYPMALMWQSFNARHPEAKHYENLKLVPRYRVYGKLPLPILKKDFPDTDSNYYG